MDWLDDDEDLASTDQTTSVEQNLREDIEREWESRRAEFRTAGIREGYDAGKEVTAQEGFDQGFRLGAASGFHWGLCKGAVATALAVSAKFPDSIHTEAAKHAFETLLKYPPNEIQRHECSALWETIGECKDKFQGREGADDLEQKTRELEVAKTSAEDTLQKADVDVSFRSLEEWNTSSY